MQFSYISHTIALSFPSMFKNVFLHNVTAWAKVKQHYNERLDTIPMSMPDRRDLQGQGGNNQ